MRLLALRADVRALRRMNPSQTAYMLADARRTDRPAGDVGACWTPLASISPLLACAVVKSEDPRFFTHRGVDPEAVERIVRSLLRGRPRFSGTSSITQQLARNIFLDAGRTVSRKTQELVLALRFEALLSKARILEIYLNVVEWGPDVWGCDAASRYYFQRAPADLDLFESTFLATLLPAPRAPLANKNARRSRFEQLHVLHQMLLCGLVTPEACLQTRQQLERLHQRLRDGAPLHDALADARGAILPPPADADRTALTDLVAHAGVQQMAPADSLAHGYGVVEERAAWRRLRARFGDEALMAVLDGGDYARLR